MLTVHILISDQDKGLGACLESLSLLPPRFELIVGDCGASSDVVRQCKERGADVVGTSLDRGLAECRNRLLERSRYDWQFYIEPWEFLVQGDVEGLVRGEGHAHNVGVIQEDHLSQQVRIWRKSRGKFVNPVYERVDAEGSTSDVLIVGGAPNTSNRDASICEEWVENSPTLPDPYYYRACARLSAGDVEGFLKDAETYFFREVDQNAVSFTMMRFYVASAHCFHRRDAGKALQHLAPCLLARPTMSEFWCLLGDIHYHILHRFDKAAEFYENAIILGSRRRKEDPWPLQISKYREYPEKMKNSCRDILSRSTRIGSVHQRLKQDV